MAVSAGRVVAVAVAALFVLWLALLGFVVVQTRAAQHQNHVQACRVRASVQSVIHYVGTFAPNDPRTQEFVRHADGLLADKTCP